MTVDFRADPYSRRGDQPKRSRPLHQPTAVEINFLILRQVAVKIVSVDLSFSYSYHNDDVTFFVVVDQSVCLFLFLVLKTVNSANNKLSNIK